MANTLELTRFRRTFILLMLLVVLPSAGLSGFGVIAIINERAAVERRIAETWREKLEAATAELERTLEGARFVIHQRAGDAVERAIELQSPRGVRLSDATFEWEGGVVRSSDPALRAALLRDPRMAEVQGRAIFSVQTADDTHLVVAQHSDGRVEGARVSLEALERLLNTDGGRDADAELARLTVRPISKRLAPESLVGKVVNEVEQARAAVSAAPVLAEQPLLPPLSDFRLVVVSVGENPVQAAATRNRAVYGVLLGLFYLALAIGVASTARTLYREARLSRMKTDFVSLISHELRTPLTSIRMFIETLALGRVKDPKQTQEVLDLLAKETARLSEMIERVLDWARIESGRKVYRREPLPVDAVLEASISAFRAQRLADDVSLETDLSAGLPLVDVDREAIAGAILNLLQNAFKYGGEGKRISVRARAEERGVAIDVEDNGAGIAPRERRKIFDRFYRVDNLLTRRTEGSGLGLAIAKRIIEAHGGRISLRSEVGRGSCFTVHLPAARKQKRTVTSEVTA